MNVAVYVRILPITYFAIYINLTIINKRCLIWGSSIKKRNILEIVLNQNAVTVITDTVQKTAIKFFARSVAW